MALKPTTIRFTPDAMDLIQQAAKRQGCSVSQFVREAALMRATMSGDDNPYPMRTLAEQLRRIGEEGEALAEKALRVAQGEGELSAPRTEQAAGDAQKSAQSDAGKAGRGKRRTKPSS